MIKFISNNYNMYLDMLDDLHGVSYLIIPKYYSYALFTDGKTAAQRHSIFIRLNR